MMRYLANFILLSFFLIVGGCKFVDENSNSYLAKRFKPVIVDDANLIGYHVTTRPHNRKVVYHQPSGYWFVFYGHGEMDPDGIFRNSWRSSKDGIHWSERHTLYEGNSHSSSLDVLLTGDSITILIFRVQYHRKEAGIPESIDGKHWAKSLKIDFPLPYEIQQFHVDNGNLLPGPIYSAMPGSWTNFAHYGSLTQDTNGFFWVGARGVIGGEKNPFQARVARSSKANDISEWEPFHVLLNGSARGTVTVQVIALKNGKVFAVIFSKPDTKIFGSLYDPKNETWEKPYVISEGNSDSKRAVASFDPGTKRLHLVYINNSGALMHKILSTPFREQDWEPKAGSESPGIKIVSNVIANPKVNDNISLSIDTSITPATLVVLYHKKTPHYYFRFYNGNEWENEEFPIGIQESNRFADEITLIREFNDKLGFVYYALPMKNQPGEIHFIDISKDILPSNL